MPVLRVIWVYVLVGCFITMAASAETPEQDAALREIEAFTNFQARSDPHYKAAEKALLERVPSIVTDNPAAQWLQLIKRLYFATSERLHREEDERIFAEERAAVGSLYSAGDAAIILERRMDILAAALEAGRLSPREQAIHAAALAIITFPKDASFIAFRRAKIPIATAYEMGRITRDEYAARWGAATSVYEQTREANARDLDSLRAQIAAEAAAAEGQAFRNFADRMRRPPPISCTSRPGPGMAIQTDCR